MLDSIASRPRLALLRRLDDAPNSSASELAVATGFHLNTVRSHLEALESAGLIERAARRSGGRGRPTLTYRLRPSGVPEAEELRPLSMLLADALESLGDEADAAARAQAVEWGRRWARRRVEESPAECACSALERLGFVVAVDGERVRLTQCPCPVVSGSRPELVCGVADGVTDGVLADSPLRAGGWQHDPKRRRCETSLVPADDPGARA